MHKGRGSYEPRPSLFVLQPLTFRRWDREVGKARHRRAIGTTVQEPTHFVRHLPRKRLRKSAARLSFSSGLKSKAHSRSCSNAGRSGRGPSLKTWPRCPPQLAQLNSVRTMPWLVSVVVVTAPGLVSQKLGQPVPLSILGMGVEQFGAAAGAFELARRAFHRLRGLDPGRSVPRSTQHTMLFRGELAVPWRSAVLDRVCHDDFLSLAP